MENRIIKFRVWSPMDNRLYVPFELTYDFPSRGGDFSVDSIFMQFTGLLDKNGKEFYTKDIFDISQTVNGQSKFILMECVGGFDVR